MFPDLSRRAEHLRERMEDPAADRTRLFRTYREFALTNRVVADWRCHYTELIRPHLCGGETRTLLDVGFGGGDIPLALAAWARRDRLALEITGIETDERALEFVSTLPPRQGVTFRLDTLENLCRNRRRFDFVIANHVLHHLDREALAPFREQTEALTVRLAVFNDIARSPLAYALFALFAPVLLSRSSYSYEDGLTSIRRSFTRCELAAEMGQRWRVRNTPRFHLMGTFEP